MLPYYSYEKESEDDSSPTKYFSRNTEEPRTVSFALPQGTYLTMQDRVGTVLVVYHNYVHLCH